MSKIQGCIGSFSRLSALMALSLAFFLSPRAEAVSFRDIDSFVNPNGSGLLVTSSAPATGSFSILSPADGDTITIPTGSGYSDAGTTYSDLSGFRPGIDQVASATAYFYLHDDNDSQADRVNISLDGGSFVNNYKITAPVLLGGALAANLVVQLNSDGRLDYTITPQGNLDFILDYARLDVSALLGGGSTQVPDSGSTLMLLGCAAAALAAAGSKINRAARSRSIA